MYKQQFFFCFLPALVSSHGCTNVELSDPAVLADFLGMNTKFVPQPVKDFAMMYPNATGVYDCHEEVNGNEVGYAGLCNDDGMCQCTALYNFEICDSCELNCGGAPDDLTINSFTANCSNVQVEDINGACIVGCNFDTNGCFEDATSVASRTMAPSSINVVMFGTVVSMAVVGVVTSFG